MSEPARAEEGGPCRGLRGRLELAASLASRAVPDAAVEEPAGRGEQRRRVQNGNLLCARQATRLFTNASRAPATNLTCKG